MMAGRDFVANGRDFYDDRSRLCCERVGFLWWQVELLLLTVEIFLMAGQDFHDDRFGSYYEQSRFSWWQVKILLWTVALHTWRGTFQHSAFIGIYQTISHTCRPNLPSRWVFIFVLSVAKQNKDAGLIKRIIFLFLVLIKAVRELSCRPYASGRM